MLFQTFVVASLCEEIIVQTSVQRIEVHEIFTWPSFVELKRNFDISAFASFVCANFRSEHTVSLSVTKKAQHPWFQRFHPPQW